MMLPSLKPISTVLCGFGNTLITPLGSVDMAVYDRTGRRFVLMFHVTEIVDMPMLGEHACELLNLVKKIEDIRGSHPLTFDVVIRNYGDVFAGTGLYAQKYCITIKDDSNRSYNNPDT